MSAAQCQQTHLIEPANVDRGMSSVASMARNRTPHRARLYRDKLNMFDGIVRAWVEKERMLLAARMALRGQRRVPWGERKRIIFFASDCTVDRRRANSSR